MKTNISMQTHAQNMIIHACACTHTLYTQVPTIREGAITHECEAMLSVFAGSRHINGLWP